MKQSDLLNGLQQLLERSKPAVRQAPATDSTSLYLFKSLMERITMLKGDTGPQGLRGLMGPRGKDGINGRDGKDGRPGRDGKDGADGKDGKDASSNPAQILNIAERVVANHEKEFNHDPFLLGTKTVDESNIGKDKFLQYNGKNLVYVDPPKAEESKGRTISIPTTGAPSHFRIKTVTESYTVDPGDQIVHVDASAGDVTITFYTAEGNLGRHHYIKRIDDSANMVTFLLQGSQTVEFEADDLLPNRGSGREVYSDGSNWFHKHA